MGQVLANARKVSRPPGRKPKVSPKATPGIVRGDQSSRRSSGFEQDLTKRVRSCLHNQGPIPGFPAFSFTAGAAYSFALAKSIKISRYADLATDR